MGQLGSRVGQLGSLVGQLESRVALLGSQAGQWESWLGKLGSQMGQLGQLGSSAERGAALQFITIS